MFSIVKWLFASLLVINSGAIIAVLGQEGIEGRAMLWSVIWFVAGVGTALLSGFVALFELQKAFPNRAAFLEIEEGYIEPEQLNLILEGEDCPSSEHLALKAA
ncbi:hypothetical protein A8B75_11645 [Sphingomonadales bacterium EhC05]|nr:hypothetical protein A8B75_11645 [Sphingomonadales bacterium EhC05]